MHYHRACTGGGKHGAMISHHHVLGIFAAIALCSPSEEISQALTGRRFICEAANDVHVRMEDVLPAGSSDVPPHGEAVRIELGQPAFRLIEHKAEIGPFFRRKIKRRFHMAVRIIMAAGLLA